MDLAKARASGFKDGAVVGRIPTGQAPIALAFSADHQFLYTTSQVAPADYGWPPVCHAPGSEAARTGSSYAQGAILVIDVLRATHALASSVVGAGPAGCNPVRLVTSPSGDGDVAYVSARTDDALLAFDTRRLFGDPSHALIARVRVGLAPVGVAVFDRGSRIAVTNSNRFGDSNATQHLTIIDARKIASGEDAVLGTVAAGIFPRELRLTEDQKTLLLTNFGSKNLAVIDIARLPLERRER